MSGIKQRRILKFKENSFINLFSHALLDAGKVKVQGIGIFEVRELNKRESYNVYDGSRITIPARKKIAFRPAKSLVEKISKWK